MKEKLGREISTKALREKHRSAYYALVILGWALLGFIFLLDLLLLVSAFNPGINAGIVKSGSMQPTIKTGSMVISAPQAEYHPGDVIVFTDPVIGTNMHRIVGIVEEGGVTYFATKGDAYEEPDHRLVPADKVSGKVELALPYLGYVAYAGFFAALVPISLIILRFLRKRGGPLPPEEALT